MDPQLQHAFKRVRVFGARGRELRAIVRQDLGKLELIPLVEQIEALQGAEHHRQALQIGHHLGPSQAGRQAHRPDRARDRLRSLLK